MNVIKLTRFNVSGLMILRRMIDADTSLPIYSKMADLYDYKNILRFPKKSSDSTKRN